jgi:Fe-S cluster assembly scaffold protein SufB
LRWKWKDLSGNAMHIQGTYSTSPSIACAVVHIGSAYSGTIMSLTTLLPAGFRAVTVVVEHGVHVTFTDTHIPSISIVFECRQNSRVVYLLELGLLQPLPIKAHNAWHVSENSTVECVLMGTIARSEVIMDLDIYLRGTLARASLYALITVDQGARCIIASRQVHTASYTTSMVRVHSLVGAAHMDYRGAIDIDRGLIDAKAIQTNKNILLSKAGKIVAIPTLQVRANKVNCTHGAAVGGLEAEHVAYLQARGIEMQRARELLLHGFLVAALEGACDESRCFVHQTIAAMMRALVL